MRLRRASAAISIVMSATLVAGCGGDEGGPPATGEELAARLGDAAASKDRAALLALVKWDGVGEEMRASQERSLGLLVDNDVAAVAVEDLPDGYRASRVRNGVACRPNVEVEGMLRVRFGARRPSGSESLSMPFGSDREGYHLAGVTETPMGEGSPGVEDVTINIAVLGGGAPSPVAFEGSCTVRRSGSEFTESIQGTGNVTRAVFGQAVEGCSVRRTSSAGWIELRISVDGERVFTSERVEQDAPLAYDPS